MTSAVSAAVSAEMAAAKMATSEVAATKSEPQSERSIIGATVIAPWIIGATIIRRRHRHHASRRRVCDIRDWHPGWNSRHGGSWRADFKADGLGENRAWRGAGNPVIGVTRRISTRRASCQQYGRTRGEADRPQHPERHHSLPPQRPYERYRPVFIALVYTIRALAPSRSDYTRRALAPAYSCR